MAARAVDGRRAHAGCCSTRASVCDGVSGRLRYELRATWLGGTRILDRLEHSRFDVVHRRPKLGVADALLIAPLVLAWRPTVALT